MEITLFVKKIAVCLLNLCLQSATTWCDKVKNELAQRMSSQMK